MKSIRDIPGLFIQENIIGPGKETRIIDWLDTREWSTTLPRRTQHFGYLYGYKGGDLKLGDPFESWISTIGEWLVEHEIVDSIDQCIVNEYNRDQKIGKHIDGKRGNRPNIFGPRIVSISLGADTNFIFTNPETKQKIELYVPRRSMMIMTGDSRYVWTHEIPKRLSINMNGKNIKKAGDYRRISLTFRKTIQ